MKKGRFLVCGLGNFGFNVARALFEKGHEVIAIDIDEKKVSEAKDYVSEAVVADAAEKQALEQIGLKGVDGAVISLGEKIDSSILSTLHLKDIGIATIIVKTISEEHSRIVTRIGATEIVFPEKEAGLRLADRLASPNVFEQIKFPENYTLVEMLAPKGLQDKTLKEAHIRSNYGITVVLIKRKKSDGTEKTIVPRPDDRVFKDDVLFVLGENENVEKFKELEP